MSSSKKARAAKGKPSPGAESALPVAAVPPDVERVKAPESQRVVAPDSSARARTETSSRSGLSAPRDLALRMLGDSLAREVIRSKATCVLVVSGRAGEGRTTLVGALVLALQELSEGSVHRVTMRDLGHADDAPDGIVVIDGPALLEGEGPLAVPAAWWARIEGAIVVSSARDVPVDELASVGRELELRGVKRLALVANERDRPPVARAIRDAIDGLLRRTFLARWMRRESVERLP